MCRGFIKGRGPGKLTGCERDLAINLPGCFCLLFLLSFIKKTKNAWLKNPTDLLHKPLSVWAMVCEYYLCRKFLVSFLPQFHRGRYNFFLCPSVVVYVQFHVKATTNVVLISLRWQWQEVSNGKCYIIIDIRNIDLQRMRGNQFLELHT